MKLSTAISDFLEEPERLIGPGFALLALAGFGWLISRVVADERKKWRARLEKQDAPMPNAAFKFECASCGQRITATECAMLSKLFRDILFNVFLKRPTPLVLRHGIEYCEAIVAIAFQRLAIHFKTAFKSSLIHSDCITCLLRLIELEADKPEYELRVYRARVWDT